MPMVGDCCSAGFRPGPRPQWVQSRPFDHIHAMSGLPLANRPTLVKFVVLSSAITRREQMQQTTWADVPLFDHLVGAGE